MKVSGMIPVKSCSASTGSPYYFLGHKIISSGTISIFARLQFLSGRLQYECCVINLTVINLHIMQKHHF